MRKPAEFDNHPYASNAVFRAVVAKVIDGDTLDVLVDLGFLVYSYITVRVLDVDTPEIFHPTKPGERDLGMKAKAFVEALLPVGTPVQITTYKDAETFGRFVASVRKLDGTTVVDLATAIKAAKLTKGDLHA